MTAICSECGNPIPDDLDFCPQCGALKKKAVNIDKDGNVVGNPEVCMFCGSELRKGAQFCQSCGKPVSVSMPGMGMYRPKLTSRDYLAMGLAFLPGAFGLFGLGHLILKRWPRAAMYLAMSAVILYIEYGTFGLSSTDSFLVEMLSFMIYLVQCMEIAALVMKPKRRN